MDHDAAVAYLAARRSLGIRPGLERITALLEAMGDPHRAYQAVHVAGTNGKTSTVRLAAALLAAHGLAAGSFTSPPLDRLEDQFARNGAPMTADELGPALDDVLPFVAINEGDGGPQLTEFELTAGLAFSWLAVNSADVAVIEAGMGGRDDATNVLEAPVVVLTGIALDHTEHLGSSIAEIAANKAEVVHPGATLVTGPLVAEADEVIAARVEAVGAEWRRYDEDFRVDGTTQAVGGWVVDVEGIYQRYDEIFLPLQGRHQVANLSVACAATEAFFGRALDAESVRSGVATVSVPGRLEIASSTPLVVLDVAHNPDAMAAVTAALAESFLPTEWTVVFGARGGRDPGPMLEPLAGSVGALIAVAADDAAAVPVAEIAAAARHTLGPGVPVTEASSVAEAIPHALAATEGTGVLVTGSHRVVAEARRVLHS